ncbi:unnamed protein product [Arctia plantaginis]|uniref:Uncharacterized protein n=1 Tax=Arctia plantaginis TaxID=874455 RepID=A0A8S1AP00_ARCPL|nr:unnamed protein product [Arctia plantaginis]
MPGLKICRICLSTGIKLYKYDRYDLKKYYEQIVGSKINERDAFPRHFCYECAAILHKFHKFKEKCYNGHKVLQELLQKGPISLKSVRYIEKQNKYLQSSLNIITVNHRVKTFIVKSKEKPNLNKTEPIEFDLDTASLSDYDDYMNLENEAEKLPPLPELVDVNKKIEDDEEKIDAEEEKVNVNADVYVEEKTEVDDEKQDIVHKEINVDEEKTNINEEKISDTSNIIEIEKIFTEDEKLESDEEKVFVNDIKLSSDEELVEKKPLQVTPKKKKSTKGKKEKKKGNDEDTDKKAKKFEITSKKKTELDSNNWLKFNLSEEEAIEEFKARAQHKRFISAEFKCNDCLKGFSKEDMLNRHIKLRHSESVGPIECRFCHMRFKWKCFLRKHMRQHYTKFKCLRCELVCPLEQTALFHEEYHNGVTRKCEHCGEEFKHLTTYYTHLRTHRSEHVCTLCGASFVSAIGLRIHKKIKHVNVEPGDTQGDQGDEEYCKRCDIKFETKKAFEEHLIHSAMHVDGIEDLEVQVPLGTNLRKRRHNLKRLTRIPTDCHLCGKHFSTQAACRKHHLAEHPRTSFFAPNERHICEICGMSLAPGSVSSHLNTHTREKLYSCSTCGRQFNSKGGMTTHQLTHTSEKPVACTLCDKRFKQTSSMKLHYRTFHLKEPYPKRNRKKKSEEGSGSKLEEYPPEESDENITLDRWP